MNSMVYEDRSDSPAGGRGSKTRPPPSAAIYITPPPQDERVPMMNVYRVVDSPMNSRPHSPSGYRSGSRTPTPCNSRPGSPIPHHASSKHNHSIQDLLKLIGKKVSGRKHKDTISPAIETRRTSCFLEVPKDAAQFRGRSKSLDDGAARKQTPSVDSATAYKIYDEILKEGKMLIETIFRSW